MRLTDEQGKPLSAMYLALSDEEASELIDALRELRSAGAGWHAHIADAALERELTVYPRTIQQRGDSRSFMGR